MNYDNKFRQQALALCIYEHVTIWGDTKILHESRMEYTREHNRTIRE